MILKRTFRVLIVVTFSTGAPLTAAAGSEMAFQADKPAMSVRKGAQILSRPPGLGVTEPCGEFSGGRALGRATLAQILAMHLEWLRGARKGKRANLCEADLTASELADLLRGANLEQANLRGIKLVGVDLSGAMLWRADLRDANLAGAKITGANLSDADLTRASLGPLLGEKIPVAPGRHDFRPWTTDLSKADLTHTRLIDADLFMADLSGAKLIFTELAGADLELVNLDSAIYEPKLDSLPSSLTVATADGLPAIRFYSSPHALSVLREEFKRLGLRQQERSITFAIRHEERQQAWNKGWTGKLESVFHLLMFEITSEYGFSPWRPFLMLFLIVLAFSVPYAIAGTFVEGRAGIWAVWQPDRVRKTEGHANPVRVLDEFFPTLFLAGRGRRWRQLQRLIRVALLGLYFSLLSAFQIGWRDINLGNWISRMQPREYTLRGTGWVRLLSGVQSVVSLYMMVLWALTYFGRPFE